MRRVGEWVVAVGGAVVVVGGPECSPGSPPMRVFECCTRPGRTERER